tara:strand:- start:39 stop:224 length:186 start_codon:yes stop_codon:yes gene_type:complete
MTKETFDELFEKQQQICAQLRTVDQAIASMQALCTHDWKYEGHGHNDDAYTCLICRKEKWE